MAKIKPGRS